MPQVQREPDASHARSTPTRLIVTVTSRGHSRQFLWELKTPLELGHPTAWLLESTQRGIQARQVRDRRGPLSPHFLQPISKAAIDTSAEIKLCGAEGPGAVAEYTVRLRNLDVPDPPFALRKIRDVINEGHRRGEALVFSGVSRHVLGSARVGRRFRVHLDNQPVFTHEQEEDLHRVRAHRDGMEIETIEGAALPVAKSAYQNLGEREWLGATVRWGAHWWRVVPVPAVEREAARPAVSAGDHREAERLWSFARWVAVGVTLAAIGLHRAAIHWERAAPPVPTVSLKAPRRLPARTMARAPAREPETSRPAPAPRRELGRRVPSGPSERTLPKARPAPVARAEGAIPSRAPSREEPVAAPAEPAEPAKPRRRITPEKQEKYRRYSARGLQLGGSGRVERSTVASSVDRLLPLFQDCYRSALERDPASGGMIVLNWRIETDGRVRDVRIAETDIEDAGLIACVSTRLLQGDFPRPRGASVTAQYTIVFASEL